MTPTPSDKAGALTEEIMFSVRTEVGYMPPRTYNRVYEAILQIVAREFPRPAVQGGRQESPRA